MKVEWISCQMVIYVNQMVAQKNVNSIAAELKLQFNSYLASDSNAFQFLIRRFFFFAVLCLFRCSDGGLKMKFITREIQIKNGSRENAINFMSFFTLSFSVFLLVNNGGKRKSQKMTIWLSMNLVFFCCLRERIRRNKAQCHFSSAPWKIIRESFQAAVKLHFHMFRLHLDQKFAVKDFFSTFLRNICAAIKMSLWSKRSNGI